jgi:hypothetical protein
VEDSCEHGNEPSGSTKDWYIFSSQISWLQVQRSRVRFPTLPDFLRSIERIIEELLELKSSGYG